MKARNRSISIFSLSLLDVISGAMGAFLIIMVYLMQFYNLENFEKEELIAQAEAAEAEAQAAADRAREAERRAEDAEAVAKEAEERLGLTLKSKDVVFVIDVSRSMGPPNSRTPGFGDFENAIEDVRAGVKMLVATMDESYRIDVVYFPYFQGSTEIGPYNQMWGELRPVASDAVKYSVYRFIGSLQANGGTPTESVLDYVVNDSRYDEAGVIFLLSDGRPIRPGTSNYLTERELAELVAKVTRENGGRKTIVTIGTGSGFQQPVSQAPPDVRIARTFLENLAAQNGGFYIGF